MSNPVTFYIDSELYNRCLDMVDDKEFSSESDMINFALHLYYYQARIKGLKPKLIRHNRKIKKMVRINHFIVDYLTDTGMFKKSELIDYALDYLLECKMKFNEECNIFE